MEGYNEMQALSPIAGPPEEPIRPIRSLSFRLAQPVPDLTLRQMLLATRSEAERLRHLAEFFPGLSGQKQRRIQQVKHLAPRNGHGTPCTRRNPRNELLTHRRRRHAVGK